MLDDVYDEHLDLCSMNIFVARLEVLLITLLQLGQIHSRSSFLFAVSCHGKQVDESNLACFN